VIFAQAAGAKLAIIYYNETANSTDFVMIDDGKGQAITIPSLLISKESGDALLEGLSNGSVTISMDFKIQKFNVVNYTFFLNFPQPEQFALIKKFKPYAIKLLEQTSFRPIYQIYECDECALDNFAQEQMNCLGGGRYCIFSSGNDKAQSIL